jgi:phosphotransferase system enzyme I (PtsI)
MKTEMPRDDRMSPTASASTIINHENGLHLRPSVKLTKLAMTFQCAIRLATAPAGPWINAKSIARVTAAKVRKGSQIHFEAEGNDASAAVAALIRLVERNFDEAESRPAAVEHHGRPAAPGKAAGPLVLFDRGISLERPHGDRGEERRALAEAVKQARAAIGALAKRSDQTGILDFQLAMLEDATCTDPAFVRIASGADAATAWSEALAVQIADFEAADTEYFRARASDLRDIRDRVLRVLAGDGEDAPPARAILTGEDMTPSRFLSVDWSRGGGIALFGGSPSSHVAMLARARGVPMVVGLGRIDLAGHGSALVDGDTGRVVLSPAAESLAPIEVAGRSDPAELAREAAILRQPAATADGEPVTVMINVAGAEELAALSPEICDGIGLVRTELLFHAGQGLPDEEAQYQAYSRIVDWAAGRPVTFRTLDAGGDKPVAGLTIVGESNPFLGTRGIRLSLKRPEIFRTQLRALARIAARGPVKVMLPMVTLPGEIDAAAQMLDAATAELERDGLACGRPPLGIMVEVPAVAIEPARYARAAFFSIGSNDLTQYVTASARDIAGVAYLCDPANPAVLSLITQVVAAGKDLGREVSLCGDMAGEPLHLPALLTSGLRIVSVAPRQVGGVKLAIAQTRTGGP